MRIITFLPIVIVLLNWNDIVLTSVIKNVKSIEELERKLDIENDDILRDYLGYYDKFIPEQIGDWCPSKCNNRSEIFIHPHFSAYCSCEKRNGRSHTVKHYCEENEIFNKTISRCNEIPGRGFRMSVVKGHRCPNDYIGITKHPDERLFRIYLVCLRDMVIMGMCTDMNQFDDAQKLCVAMNETDDNLIRSVCPKVKKLECDEPGIFPVKFDEKVPQRCNKCYYICSLKDEHTFDSKISCETKPEDIFDLNATLGEIAGGETKTIESYQKYYTQISGNERTRRQTSSVLNHANKTQNFKNAKLLQVDEVTQRNPFDNSNKTKNRQLGNRDDFSSVETSETTRKNWNDGTQTYENEQQQDQINPDVISTKIPREVTEFHSNMDSSENSKKVQISKYGQSGKEDKPDGLSFNTPQKETIFKNFGTIATKEITRRNRVNETPTSEEEQPRGQNKSGRTSTENRGDEIDTSANIHSGRTETHGDTRYGDDIEDEDITENNLIRNVKSFVYGKSSTDTISREMEKNNESSEDTRSGEDTRDNDITNEYPVDDVKYYENDEPRNNTRRRKRHLMNLTETSENGQTGKHTRPGKTISKHPIVEFDTLEDTMSREMKGNYETSENGQPSKHTRRSKITAKYPVIKSESSQHTIPKENIEDDKTIEEYRIHDAETNGDTISAEDTRQRKTIHKHPVNHKQTTENSQSGEHTQRSQTTAKFLVGYSKTSQADNTQSSENNGPRNNNRHGKITHEHSVRHPENPENGLPGEHTRHGKSTAKYPEVELETSEDSISEEDIEDNDTSEESLIHDIKSFVFGKPGNKTRPGKKKQKDLVNHTATSGNIKSGKYTRHGKTTHKYSEPNHSISFENNEPNNNSRSGKKTHKHSVKQIGSPQKGQPGNHTIFGKYIEYDDITDKYPVKFFDYGRPSKNTRRRKPVHKHLANHTETLKNDHSGKHRREYIEDDDRTDEVTKSFINGKPKNDTRHGKTGHRYSQSDIRSSKNGQPSTHTQRSKTMVNYPISDYETFENTITTTDITFEYPDDDTVKIKPTCQTHSERPCFKEGFFRLNQSCTQHYECYYNKKCGKIISSEVYECPNCLKFNARKGRCDLPKYVPECTTHKKTYQIYQQHIVFKPMKLCSGPGVFPDPSNETKYYKCVDILGENTYYLTSVDCPSKTRFNPYSNKCDSNYHYKHNLYSHVLGPCNTDSFAFHKYSCQKFFKCFEKQYPVALKCLDGYIFNGKYCQLLKLTNYCDWNALSNFLYKKM